MLLITIYFLLINQVSSDILFDRVKPIIWLKSNSIVSPGTAEYDVNFAYTSPCGLFEKNIRRNLGADEKLKPDDVAKLEAFSSSCKALYILEWQHEVEQLLSATSKSLAIRQHHYQPSKPYNEGKSVRKREVPIKEAYEKEDFDKLSTYSTWRSLTHVLLGPFSYFFFDQTERERETRDG